MSKSIECACTRVGCLPVSCELTARSNVGYRGLLDTADPYLGDIVGKYTDWTPLKDHRARLASATGATAGARPLLSPC